MDYKKINKENLTIHLINTNRFKTINVVVFFTREFDKNDIVYGNTLVYNMVYSSKKYNTKNRIAIQGEKLYGAKVSSSFMLSGALESFVFSLDFVNPKYTEEKYLKESLDYLKEVIFNPNVSNEEFNPEYYNIIKNDTISKINSIKINPNLYAGIEYAKIMYDKTPSSYSSIPTLEELESIDSKKLYKFYKSLFDGSYKIDVCVLGEVNDDIVNIIDDMFRGVKSNNKKMSLMINHKYSDKVNEKQESLPFNQSKLYIGYRLIDMNYHELNHVLRIYNTILGTMNDSVLFNIVREENSLCYSIGSYISRYNPSLTIYAGINKENYERTIDLVRKCVSDMSNEKQVSRLFDSAKKTINTYLNNYYDDAVSQINTYYNKEFEDVEDIETLRENINKVTIDEVVKLNEKIKLSTIYLLKGDNN